MFYIAKPKIKYPFLAPKHILGSFFPSNTKSSCILHKYKQIYVVYFIQGHGNDYVKHKLIKKKENSLLFKLENYNSCFKNQQQTYYIKEDSLINHTKNVAPNSR